MIWLLIVVIPLGLTALVCGSIERTRTCGEWIEDEPYLHRVGTSGSGATASSPARRALDPGGSLETTPFGARVVDAAQGHPASQQTTAQPARLEGNGAGRSTEGP